MKTVTNVKQSTDLKAKLFNGSKVPYFKSDSKTLVLNTDILINSNFSHVCTAQYDGLLKFTRNKGLFWTLDLAKNHYFGRYASRAQKTMDWIFDFANGFWNFALC